MSFADAGRRTRTAPIVAVAAIHGLIAYAFITGLAYEVFPHEDVPIVARDIPDEVPPPPHDLPPPQRTVERRADVAQDRIIVVPNFDGGAIAQPDLGRTEPVGPAAAAQPPIASPPPSRAQPASVVGARASWVTTDDYPAAALRAGVEGIVGITVAIDASGRVTACEVTASSGNAALDQATCRTYSRRARFIPALDEQGRPTPSRHDDRVRWQIPPQ